MAEPDTCRTYEADGVPVVVHDGEPLDEPGRAALGELVRATKQLVGRDHPDLAVAQELIAAARHAAWCIPDGPVSSRTVNGQTGAEVKVRLRAAVQAARVALTPAEANAEVRNGAAAVLNLDELAMVALVARGHTYTTTGRLIGGLGREAVKSRLARIRRKVGATSTVHLVALCLSRGLIPPLREDTKP